MGEFCRVIIDGTIGEEQCGYRSDRGCVDQIFELSGVRKVPNKLKRCIWSPLVSGKSHRLT